MTRSRANFIAMLRNEYVLIFALIDDKAYLSRHEHLIHRKTLAKLVPVSTFWLDLHSLCWPCDTILFFIIYLTVHIYIYIYIYIYYTLALDYIA